ncbi:DUF5689 domain-containing protein [Ornithobacterium rhinotracheale]|uniref:DUF5689 domain-containing protein n=1 Tax=Ornithobacterium rhinotracheale TaxID=28251 RepID=UPI001FF6AFF6|nr:DUF5689 domain-containing protein [Ornithobacterium rhinotracheale]MCK0205899.1 DUF5689 domain-containing protein [Ornithobacterium rhinotracheale]
MKNKTTLKLFSLLFFISFGLWSCVDNEDHGLPNLDLNCVSDDANETISPIQSLVKDFSGNHEITENVILSGYVVSSDEGGNFYQQIIIQDNKSPEFNGIEVSAAIKGYSDYFPIGARVKVFAKGLIIAKDRGVIKLGVKDSKFPVGRIPEKEVFNHLKFYCNKELETPAAKVYTDISKALQDGNVSTLIRLENVYFPAANGQQTFVPKSEKASNLSIKDEKGNTLDLRNSSFVKWADNIVPRGKGSITLILSKYNDSYQAFINNLSDINIKDDPNFTAPTQTQDIKTLEAANANESDFKLNEKVKLHGFIKLINGKLSSIDFGDGTVIQIQAKKGLWNTLPKAFQDKINKEGQEVTITGTFSNYTLKDKKVVKAIVYEAESDVEFGDATAPSAPTNPAPTTLTTGEESNANLIDFEGISDISNSYNSTGTINGKDGVVVTFVGRTDMDKYPIEGKGIMIKDNSYVKITFPKGVKTIELDYRSAYTNKTKRKLKIIEGDENSENIIDTKTFDISDDIHKLKLTPNATGKYILTLKADSKQVVIDNIKWTK